MNTIYCDSAEDKCLLKTIENLKILEGIRSVGLAKVNCHDVGLSVLDTVRFVPGVIPPLPDFYQGQRLILNLPERQRQSWDGDFPPPSPHAGSDEEQRPFDDLTNRFQCHPSAFLSWVLLPLSREDSQSTSLQSGSVLSLWHPETQLVTNQFEGFYSLKNNRSCNQAE